MQTRTCILLGTSLAALGVILGAFGAHALKDTLEASDQLENWRTGVRYQMWHASALILYGIYRRDGKGRSLPPLFFFLGTLLFCGSIYALCFSFMKSVMGPITPLGGLFLILGWIGFALQALRGDTPK